jgi:uncharacterized OB-fold protein
MDQCGMSREQLAPAAIPELAPFHEGLFDADPEGLCLRGAYCRSCGLTLYPFTSMCLSCLAADPEDVRLSREGVLESFTTVHLPAERIAPPYRVGYVRLPEGLRIFAPIEPGDHALHIGMPMRIQPFPLNSVRGQALAYCFTPA